MLKIQVVNGRYVITHPVTGVEFICDAGRQMEFIDSFLPKCRKIVFA